MRVCVAIFISTFSRGTHHIWLLLLMLLLLWKLLLRYLLGSLMYLMLRQLLWLCRHLWKLLVLLGHG